jgi:hypothetical protein
MGDDRHPGHRREHQPDRDHRDGAEVLPDVAEIGEERGAVDQDRQEHDQHDVRVELDRGYARDEAEDDAADHEHDRVGDREAPGERAEAGDRHQ